MSAGSSHSYFFKAVDLRETIREPSTGETNGPFVSSTGSNIPGFSIIYSLFAIIIFISLALWLIPKRNKFKIC